MPTCARRAGNAASGWRWTSQGSSKKILSVAPPLGWEPSEVLALGKDVNISPCVDPRASLLSTTTESLTAGALGLPDALRVLGLEGQLVPLTSSSPGGVRARVTHSVPAGSAAVANDVYCILCSSPR